MMLGRGAFGVAHQGDSVFGGELIRAHDEVEILLPLRKLKVLDGAVGAAARAVYQYVESAVEFFRGEVKYGFELIEVVEVGLVGM